MDKASSTKWSVQGRDLRSNTAPSAPPERTYILAYSYMGKVIWLTLLYRGHATNFYTVFDPGLCRALYLYMYRAKKEFGKSLMVSWHAYNYMRLQCTFRHTFAKFFHMFPSYIYVLIQTRNSCLNLVCLESFIWPFIYASINHKRWYK